MDERVTSLTQDLISGPKLSRNCTITENILQFSYDCKRLFNLCLIEPDVLCFASGNLIHFFRVSTGEINTRRSACGGGIGFITKNPVTDKYPNHLVVAENGIEPPIIVYNYPSMEVISMLKGGTTRCYTKIDHSPDGEMLVSQGGKPDYMLTIWNWKTGEMILRGQSFSNDVVNIMFSPWVPGHLTSSGAGHIKFWQMANTFTGVKLQGSLGRFGKTEISDIVGIYPMADEKVLSGSEWGNILVWDGGIIKLEVFRKGRKQCHSAPITQILMQNKEEVITVGQDGYIRIWFWETVELAEPPEDDRVVEIDPIYEFRIGNAQLMGMVKMVGGDDDFKWYVQTASGNGGIWECDISPEYDPDPPKQIFKCHAGAIVSVQTSPISHHVATLGEDGRIFVYDFDRNKCVFDHQFLTEGRDMIWLPLSVDPSGIVLVIGFSDGFLRSVTVDLNDSCPGDRVQLIQLIKPHANGITKLSINSKETILVSGSEDETVFVHKLIKGTPYVTLLPISMVNLSAVPTVISWHPFSHCKALIGCSHGEIFEVDLIDREGSHIDLTYNASHVQVKALTFKSTKSEIRRNIRLQEIEAAKETKLLKKQRSLERLRRENPEVEIDEKTFLEDSDDEEELEELYIPPIGNPILWLTYAQNGMILLMVGGYDAGYVYEYDLEALESEGTQVQPSRCTLIPQGDDIEVHAVVSFEDHLIFGMGDGSIRINKIENDDPTNLSDYWLLHMHDNFNGRMSICFSHDHEFMITAGADGNLFTYKWTTPIEKVKSIGLKTVKPIDQKVYDIDDPKYLSLEQQKQKYNYDRRMAIADEKKRGVLQVIDGLRQRYQKVLERNNRLPTSQQLTVTELEVDPRLTADLTMKLMKEMELVNQKMAFDVEKEKLAGKKLLEYFIEPLQSFPIEVIGINSQRSVKTIRIQKLTEEFHGLKEDLKERIRRDKERKRISDTMQGSYIASEEESTQRTESFLYGLTESSRLETKMERLLNKYRERKAREEKRKYEWRQVNAEKPDPNQNHPDDDKALQEAENSIGDYKLKSDEAYDPPEDVRDTLFKKFDELLRIREEIFQLRKGFNDEVIKLRDKKLGIEEYINRKTKELVYIHQYLGENERKLPTVSVVFCDEREFPEKLLDLEFYSKRKQSIQEQHLQERKVHVIFTNPEDLQMMFLRPLEEHFDFEASNVIMSEDVRAELKRIEAEDAQNTAFEDEQLERKHCTYLFRQDRILAKIDERIQMFDKELETLFEKRLQVQVDAKFLDNYLLTLNQEVWLLKDYEKIEENYIIDVEKNIVERNRLHREIQAIRAALEAKRKHMDREKEQLKSLFVQFKSKCMTDKFAPFLKKVFKKKLRPPRAADADSESSTSESSESDDDDDDGRSEGSNDMAFLYLDENQCPKGCDLGLYQLVFQLREERYKGEAEIRNSQAFIDKAMEDIEKLTKTFKATQAELDHCKTKLSMFRREKQKKLNDVETLVILRMDQLQHFTDESDFGQIDNTLLFNNSNVGKLYSRVGQITLETLETKRRHRVNIVHLARMNTDIKFMEQQIVDLKGEINGTMMKKFGRIVDLDELEETILRQMVYNMRANVDEVKKEYARKIAAVEKEYGEKQDQLKNVLQRKTEKLNILTVLEEEKNYLDAVLWNQQKQTCKAEPKRINYSEDLKKLKEILGQQLEQIVAIHREIQTLTLKNKPLTPSPVNMCKSKNSQSLPQIATTNDHNEPLSLNMTKSKSGNTRATSLDNECYDEICAMIEQFLTQHLSQSADQKELIEVQDNIVRYLIGLSASLEAEFTDDFLPRVIETLKTFLPQRHLTTIAQEELTMIVKDVMKFLGDINNVTGREVISDTEDVD